MSDLKSVPVHSRRRLGKFYFAGDHKPVMESVKLTTYKKAKKAHERVKKAVASEKKKVEKVVKTAKKRVKKVAVSAGVSAPVASQMAEQVAEPAKKKRGRPSKKMASVAPVAPVAKPKRGRPKKAQTLGLL